MDIEARILHIYESKKIFWMIFKLEFALMVLPVFSQQTTFTYDAAGNTLALKGVLNGP